MRRTLLLVLMLLAGAALPSRLLAAPLSRSLTLERFEADIHVQRDGGILVKEVLQVRFEGSWNGVYRAISLGHTNARGKRERLRLSVRQVTDGSGNPLRYETERASGQHKLKIWVPDAENVTRTVVVEYRVENALRFFEQEQPEGLLDELYWQVTGTEWEMPIRSASARVYLPEGVTAQQAAAYVGSASSTEQPRDLQIEGEMVHVSAGRTLNPGEGLTVAVGWPAGVVQRPSEAAQAVSMVQQWWPLVLPLLAFLGMFGHWKRHGRDPKRRSVAVQYEPPAELSPAEIGTLVDHSADMRDITSTLVDLAVRGYVTIEEREERRLLGLVKEREYTFHLRRPEREWEGLAPHERIFLNGLFETASLPSLVAGNGGGASWSSHGAVELSELKNKFYKKLPKIRDEIYRQLVRKGHYLKRPDQVKMMYVVGGLVVGAGAFFGAIWVNESGFGGLHPIAVSVGLGLSALWVIGFGLFMPARTERGARAQEAALGFREFLDKVETDRFRRMITSPEMFERYLPFAMAFGVEKRWANAFEGLYTEPPEWYHGHHHAGGFHTAVFVGDLSRMTSQAGSTMSSSPSSSGSGGGGSVGGGSGGGGGGGF